MYTSHHPCWDAKNRWGLAEEVEFDYSVIAPHIYLDEGNTPVSVPAEPTASMEAPAPTPAVPPLQPEPVPSPQEQLAINISPAIPQALADLMIQNQVTEDEIRHAVSLKGYYPEDTPMDNYDPKFVQGVLIGAWDKVFATIMNERDLPF